MKRVVLLSGMFSIALFAVAQQNHSDCNTARILCNNESVEVKSLPGPGVEKDISEALCVNENFPETNSIWFKWTMGSSGELGFSIIPVNEKDDLDFVLYKMQGATNNCGEKLAVRCMASGQNRGEVNPDVSRKCLGMTGLSIASDGVDEAAGCSQEDDNFLSAVHVNKGETYSLAINNYYSNNGFLLEFTGTATISPDYSNCGQIGEGNEPVGLQDIKDTGLVIDAIYPNPARSEVLFTVISKKAYAGGQLQLVSLHGDLLKTQPISILPGIQDITIDIGSLPVGVYFLKTIIGENVHVARFSKF